MSRLRGALSFAAQCLLILGCAQTRRLTWDSPSDIPRKAYPLLCGQPLATKCQFQNLSFTELPSRAPASELYSSARGELAGGVTEPDSLQALLSFREGEAFPEPIFGLERVARGYYGDSLETRQDA